MKAGVTSDQLCGFRQEPCLLSASRLLLGNGYGESWLWIQGSRRGPPSAQLAVLTLPPPVGRAVRGSHAAALLAWLGEGAAESRLHVRTHSCRVEPVPSADPPPQITGLASRPPPAQLWLCHPSPDMPRFALQSVLGTARTSSERRGFGLRLSVALARALGDRGPGSFSAPSLPVASVLGHLRLPGIYSLG